MDEAELSRARQNLYYWQYPGKDGPSTSFSSIMFGLLQKSDKGNVEKIRRGFPELVAVWEEWSFAVDEDKCFESWGFDVWARRTG